MEFCFYSHPNLGNSRREAEQYGICRCHWQFWSGGTWLHWWLHHRIMGSDYWCSSRSSGSTMSLWDNFNLERICLQNLKMYLAYLPHSWNYLVCRYQSLIEVSLITYQFSIWGAEVRQLVLIFIVSILALLEGLFFFRVPDRSSSKTTLNYHCYVPP